MELSKKDIKITKGLAILFMIFLHLFCRKEINGLYQPFIKLNGTPLIYYLALFCDACVPIYCFSSGYGLFLSIDKNCISPMKKNLLRIFKLLTNYWIVLVAFVFIGYICGETDIFPGSFGKFFLNFFVLSSSYNGAWWFIQTYIILVLLSPFFFKLVKKYNSIILLLLSMIIYFLSYLQRIKHVLNLGDNLILITFINALILVGTSQLPFLVGSIFAKEKIYSKIHTKFDTFKFKNALCALIILVLIITHSIYESMFLAPFTGIIFLCLFNIMDKSILLQMILNFFGNHSTNLWLTHMFFYMSIFPKLTFEPKYPLLIYLWLILLCLVSSYVINYINKPIIKFIDNRFLSSI